MTARPDGAAHGSGAQRWLARAALALAAAAVLLPPLVAGVGAAVGLALVGLAGLAIALVGLWWFLTNRGAVRWLAAALAAAGPLAVVVLYALFGLLWVAVTVAALWVGALAAAAAALTVPAATEAPGRPAPPVRHAVFVMNPRSGGGKVERFGLAELARRKGATVVLLDGADVDVVEIARKAVADGADLLGVAGGDGTQALVAAVAAEHDLPFLVISAGTRNHFARDLGLDLENPARCLDALEEGVEVRIDLGDVDGRTFVNNASFGAYAAVVQSPGYREAKMRTALDQLPETVAVGGPALRVSVDGEWIRGPQAVLVSNNPYDWTDPTRPGRRPRLDSGVLGVLTVRVEGAAGAASLVRGLASRSVQRSTATDVVVDADGPVVAVGVDGEALTLPAPVHCTVRPGALRVRVPRGARPESPRPAIDWARLRALAFGRPPSSA